MNRYFALKKFCLTANAAIALALFSCSTTVVTINSVPVGADVMKVSGAGNKTTLGQTPMKVDMGSSLDAGDDALQLTVGKADYLSQSIMLPKTLSPAQHNLTIHLLEQPKLSTLLERQAAECPKLPDDMIVQVTRAVAEAQGLIASKNYTAAATKLIVMSTQYPNISVLHDLLGNVYFLQREFNQALLSYERSVLLDPQNTEAIRMVRTVRGLMGMPEQKVGH